MQRDVRDLIAAKGYTIRTFAAAIDMPYMTLYNAINRGKSLEHTSYKNFRAIANGLGLDSDGLDQWLNSKDAQ